MREFHFSVWQKSACSLDLAALNTGADRVQSACESQSESRWHAVSLVETVPDGRDSRGWFNYESSDGC